MHVLQVGEQSAPTVQLLLTENTLVWILIQMFDQDVILYFSLRSELTGTMLAWMRTTICYFFLNIESQSQFSTVKHSRFRFFRLSLTGRTGSVALSLSPSGSGLTIVLE
uniref:Uncharacterized protein n=1 Tax=Cacopsylla melanoneura TaxID=428564 RepID=A0A8D9FCU3_9HEMI